MLFPSCRREIFKLPLPPRSLFVNTARFALIRVGLSAVSRPNDTSFSRHISILDQIFSKPYNKYYKEDIELHISMILKRSAVL